MYHQLTATANGTNQIKMRVFNVNFENCFGTNNVNTKIQSIVQDNRDYIIDYTEKGNVSEYILNDLVEGDQQEYNWMNNECAEHYEKLDSDEKAVITDMLIDFIKENYNYNLKRTFRILTQDTIGNEFIWDIFTKDGETLENSEYFFQDGDSPSFDAQNQISEKVENRDWLEL